MTGYYAPIGRNVRGCDVAERWYELIHAPLKEMSESADPWAVIPQLRSDLDRATVENRHLRAVLSEAIRQLGGDLFVTDKQAAGMPLQVTIRSEGDHGTGKVRIWVATS